MNSFPPSNGRVLVIEDEADLQEALVTYLNIEGFTADGVSSLSAASQWIRTHQFDVLILDLGLSDGDGLQWLVQNEMLRQKGVIITTARGDSKQRIEGIRSGADVYLVKPIQLEELASLVSNLMRRIQAPTLPQWTLSKMNWTLNSPTGVSVKLTHSEAVLLQKMADHPGQAIARQDLVISLGHNPETYDFRRMEILVRRLRNKIRDALGDELPLETVHKVGYAFTSPLKVV
jgi:two-component system OmpR family response regulator